MNVVKKVANSVRRPAVFRAGKSVTVHSLRSLYYGVCVHADSGQASLLIDPAREPFLYEIQQQALHYLMPGAQSTTEEKMQGYKFSYRVKYELNIVILQQLQRSATCLGQVDERVLCDIRKSRTYNSISQGGKPASEFATKNYLAQMIHLLSTKDPSYAALRLV